MRGHGLTNQSVAPYSVVTEIDQVGDNLVSTGIMYQTGGVITTDGAEQTVLIMDSPMGLAYVMGVLFDLDPMGAGETVVFRNYQRIAVGGGMLLMDYDSYVGVDGGLANGEVLADVGGAIYRHGYQLTIQRTGGADHAYTWEAYLVGE